MGIAIGLYYVYMFYVINVAFQIDSEIKCIIWYCVELYIYIQGNTQFLWKTIFISKVCIETNVYGEGSNELRASTSKKIILHPM